MTRIKKLEVIESNWRIKYLAVLLACAIGVGVVVVNAQAIDGCEVVK